MRWLSVNVSLNKNIRMANPDDQPVAAAGNDMTAAFNALMSEYYIPIETYISHIVQDAESASELTQDVFIIALQKMEHQSDDQNFRSWLYRVAHNTAVSHLRKQQVARVLSLEGLLERLAVLPVARSRHSEADTIVLHDAIRQALSALSESEREAVILHSVAGINTNEIATIMRISPAAAGRRISRGKEHFRHIYVDAVDD